MPRKPSLVRGKRLNQVPQGSILGRNTANELALLYGAITNAIITQGASAQILIGDQRIVFQLPSGAFQSGGTSSSGMLFRGEYDPATTDYVVQNLVAFTPDGGSAGMYIALQTVGAGVTPDTGSPNWFAWPNSPPGVFA